MRYIVSDIHGCYQEYLELLQKIEFSDADALFVLGDVIDRGAESIQVLQDMMQRENVSYILGNHEQMFSQTIRALLSETIPQFQKKKPLNGAVNVQAKREEYLRWMMNGGNNTMEQFLNLPVTEQIALLLYVEKAVPYQILKEKDCLYVLVHAGIKDFSPEKALEEYSDSAFLWERADYTKQYYPDEKTFLVTGHTPTPFIREDRKPFVYQDKGHIALDCGCVFGGQLAAYCIETGQVTYVPHKKKRA